MKRFIVISNEEMYENIFLLKLEGGEGDVESRPGSFSMIEAGDSTDPLLLRPLSLSYVCGNTFSFLYEKKGIGTELLSKKRSGDFVRAVLNLGNGFMIPEERGRVALISGGLGIAPMKLLAKELNRKQDITLIAGFRTGAYYIDEIKPFVSKILIATEDGSVGSKGLVTDLIDPYEYAYVMTCGPMPMMREVSRLCLRGHAKVEVSLEGRMACGIGACFGCSVKSSEGMKKICKDGPVFDGRWFLENICGISREEF